MLRRTLIPGLIGGLVLVLWAFLVNGVLGLKANLEMNQVANERHVYEVLKENVTEPGRYVCNPAVDESGMFPAGEPVFGVLYGGVGHEVAGREALLQLLFFFAVPLLAVWLLLHAEDGVLARFTSKLAFFVVLGLIVGILHRLAESSIAGYPMGHTLVLFANDVLMWTVLGLVIAWIIKPKEA